jgi:serine/threonine protein kinase
MECCAANPPGRRFCCTCGQLLNSKGTLQNPQTGWAYQIIRKLGQGGMSNTYLIYSQHHAKVAVLKEIHTVGAAQAKAEELFQREARVLQSLQHPGIPVFYDFFEQTEKSYLVLEMIHGLTLEQAQPQSIQEAVQWILKICQTLRYLHSRTPPIIHRDIKPANLILRQSDQQIILIDYGAVKEAGSELGTRISTLGYSAPEQKFGQPCFQSDFYALGTTLLYVITRRYPGTLYHSKEKRFMGLEALGISPGLAQALYRLTDIDPAHRPSTVDAVITLLAPFS